MLGIAGAMLKQFGGEITEMFVEMLTANEGEVLRVGEFGDLNVSIEDRIISESLNHYQGPDRDKVVALFYTFGLFPEDVPVPVTFFDFLAGPVFGAKVPAASSDKVGDLFNWCR